MDDLTLDQWRAAFASDIVGSSPELISALELVRQVAGTECSVLITGETGTGKELFAHAVHRSSERRKGPFIAVNCAAIPDSLLETELFGHLRGAFTGAAGARAGKFAAAQGGTLFLDEIGDLPLAAQAKLLRVLEQRTVCPVGSDLEVPIDVRVVAATHRDLEDMVARGLFRADLYFRLAVVPLELPPLRDRGADVDELALAAISRANQRMGRRVEGLDRGAVEALHTYRWPGNARELVHVIERAVVLVGTGRLTALHLRLGPGRQTPPVGLPVMGRPFATGTTPLNTLGGPGLGPHPGPGGGGGGGLAPEAPMAQGSSPGLDLRAAIESLEKRMIDEALQRAGGNRTEAAALLGLNRTTLVEKLRKYAA
ncbi:MAG: sigma 54-interacting transcriptional regulator [Kofleriaceae bacterium]|nr:sigma 54-interacting transcriptional regulator [Kofleriaceae bacterium]MBP6835828.1 sigma 54-interacting transcriptional regulator [Kofleriaceae bacterium]